MRQRVLIAMALACQPGAGHRRRTDDGARRDDSGADSRPAARDEGRVRPVAAAHHARPRRHRRDGRPRRRDVRRPHRRARTGARRSFASRSIPTRAGCWRRCRAARPASGCAPSTATCRCSASCRPAARSTRAAPTASSRAPTAPPPDYVVGAGHTAKCYLHDPPRHEPRCSVMPLVEVSHLVKHFVRDGGLFRAGHASSPRWTM